MVIWGGVGVSIPIRTVLPAYSPTTVPVFFSTLPQIPVLPVSSGLGVSRVWGVGCIDGIAFRLYD